MAARAASLLESRWSDLLLPASWVYGSVAKRRRARLAANQVRLPVPVISVGNITCGGTGKTPVVEMLARHLLARRRRPAILSRGYRRGDDGLNDEARVLADNLPGVPQFLSPDRISSGRSAIAAGADALLLDDGFQYARLARDLEIVLIDALDPFGGGRVLPAGLLREPLEALRGAGLLGITRGDLAPPMARRVLEGILRERCPGVPRIDIRAEPVAWEPVGRGGPSLEPRAVHGRSVLGFAGLGNPNAFRLQLLGLGVRLVDWLPFPDHHRYRPGDLEEIQRRARSAGAEEVLTTQKDAVKLPPPGGGPPWRFLKIACRPASDPAALEAALDRALAGAGGEARR
jgi:tetraacyldisaccharide 4'-kinase